MIDFTTLYFCWMSSSNILFFPIGVSNISITIHWRLTFCLVVDTGPCRSFLPFEFQCRRIPVSIIAGNLKDFQTVKLSGWSHVASLWWRGAWRLCLSICCTVRRNWRHWDGNCRPTWLVFISARLDQCFGHSQLTLGHRIEQKVFRTRHRLLASRPARPLIRNSHPSLHRPSDVFLFHWSLRGLCRRGLSVG